MINIYDEKIKDLKDNLQNTFCDNICDYDNGYICDVISEISDNNIDIYYYNLFDWLKNNYSDVEDAIDEFGEPRDAKGHFDIIKAIQQGQYYQFTNELYENFEDMMLLFIYDYLQKNDINLNDEQIEELENYISSVDNNDKLDDVICKIEEIKESKEG